MLRKLFKFKCILNVLFVLKVIVYLYLKVIKCDIKCDVVDIREVSF